MRHDDDFIRDVSRIKTSIEELKTAQITGSDQLVVEGVKQSKNIQMTGTFQAIGTSLKTIKLTVIADNLDKENILLAFMIAGLYKNNQQLITIKNGAIDYTVRSWLKEIESEENNKRIWIFSVIAPTGENYEVRAEALATTKINLIMEEL